MGGNGFGANSARQERPQIVELGEMQRAQSVNAADLGQQIWSVSPKRKRGQARNSYRRVLEADVKQRDTIGTVGETDLRPEYLTDSRWQRMPHLGQ